MESVNSEDRLWCAQSSLSPRGLVAQDPPDAETSMCLQDTGAVFAYNLSSYVLSIMSRLLMIPMQHECKCCYATWLREKGKGRKCVCAQYRLFLFPGYSQPSAVEPTGAAGPPHVYMNT